MNASAKHLNSVDKQLQNVIEKTVATDTQFAQGVQTMERKDVKWEGSREKERAV